MDKISINVKKIPDFLDARFKTNELDDNLLEIENQHGFPKNIYVNDKGEIWTSKADGVSKAKTPAGAAKEIRSIVSRSVENSFKVSDMFKMVVPPTECPEAPQLDEEEILKQGSEITKDILQEPEIANLKLSSEDEHQVAIMVFDSILHEKNANLENLEVHVAKRVASNFNEMFKNMSFLNSGDYVHVFFDTKVAGDQEFTKEQIEEVLKYALSDLNLVNLYNEIVADYIKKISSDEPDYFKLRDVVISEVLEQINGQK